jgi:tRNA modification GTPase
MFSSDDTIVAIATPAGRAGIGVVRLSGTRATDMASRIVTRRAALLPRQATLTKVRVDQVDSRSVADQVVVTWFPAPHSYTGEDVVEISAHGSPVVLRGIVSSLVAVGARLARPGEFTLRAFLNARMDLAQAEAVADLIDAATPLQAQTAFDQLSGTLSDRIETLDGVLLDLIARLEASLDFPEEGFHFIEPDEVSERLGEMLAELNAVLLHETRGRLIREGATVVISGRVNTGKSSLFNALIGHARAIVTDIPGTTRDLLTETIDLDGLAVTLVDTAGERDTQDAVEREGVFRAARAREVADLTLIVIDAGETLSAEDHRLLERSSAATSLVVARKSDREPKWEMAGALRVSTLRNTGLNELRRAMLSKLAGEEPLRDPAPISNLRHVSLLREVRTTLARACAAMREQGAPEEFVLVELHRARASLAEVVGAGSSDETLDYIFSHFCIGK